MAAALLAPTAAVHVFALPLLLVQALGEVNVYDKPMTNCGPDHSTGCTYVAEDAGAHQVCVEQLPLGFSAETGQGHWSDAYEGQPWCICIWAYSNYILQKKDLKLKCESIPSKVLEEKYSLDKFKQCGTMSSTEGCGSEDIRRSIQSLCQQCGEQAGDDNSKAALKGKCDKILASAPAANMQRLDSEDTTIASLRGSESGIQSLALGVVGLVLAGASVGIVVRAVRKGWSIRYQHSQQTGAELIAEENIE